MSKKSHAKVGLQFAVLNFCGVRLQVEQRSEEEKLKGVYGFNQLVSDEISLNRSVPELREEECKWWDYPTDMPTASVILVFHNEGWSTLLRTVNSVINRCVICMDFSAAAGALLPHESSQLGNNSQ